MPSSYLTYYRQYPDKYYFIEIIEQSFCQDKAFAILAVAVISNTICPPLKQWWHKQCHQVAINNYFVGDDGFESALQFDVVDQATNHCNEFLSALEDNIATESCSDWCTVKDCYLSHTSSHHQIQSTFHCITLSLQRCITFVIYSIQILCDAHSKTYFLTVMHPAHFTCHSPGGDAATTSTAAGK